MSKVDWAEGRRALVMDDDGRWVEAEGGAHVGLPPHWDLNPERVLPQLSAPDEGATKRTLPMQCPYCYETEGRHTEGSWCASVIAQAEKLDEFAATDDGYTAWLPEFGGYITADVLRILANELDRRNAEWDAQVERDLGGEE